MTIRHILVHVEPGETSAQRLRYALSLARSYEARVTGLSVRPFPDTVAFSMIGDAQAYAALSEACDETCVQARKLFEKTTADSGLVVNWREGRGIPAEVIAAEAACADLLILAKNNPPDPSGALYPVQPADVVLACGRPVLVTPIHPPEEFHCRRVLLAWKSSPQAARAAHDALPLMVGADEVIVAEMISRHETASYEISGEMVADHLRMHDLKVTTMRIDQPGDAGELLIGASRERACDLIVAGAFGHSRIREWVLGGVTRTLLTEDTPSLLLSH